MGRTAVALDTGRRHPVHEAELRGAADFAWTGYLMRLVNETTNVLGFTWEPLAGHVSGDEEIVDPPIAEHLAGHALGVRPGECPREQILADAQRRTDVAESARLIAAEQARRTG